MTQTQEVISEADVTPKYQHLDKYKWKPGQSGNPSGRTKGARGRLSEDFLEKLYKDFKENGQKVIETVRCERPSEYLKVVASLIPKEFLFKEASVGDVSDEELLDKLNTIRHLFLAGTGTEIEGRVEQETVEEVTDAITV